MPSTFLNVDLRTLHLPHARASGADPWKFQRQLAGFGDLPKGMPLIPVTRCKDGRLSILVGVTRATRVARLLPGQLETVDVTDDEPNRDVSCFPTIGDFVP
jgi:hypothetical protein